MNVSIIKIISRPGEYYWADILDSKGQVDTFILDFEKAFDTPPHELLKINCLVMELVVKH